MRNLLIIPAILFSAMIFAGAASAQTSNTVSQESEKIYEVNEVDQKPRITIEKRAKAEKCNGRSGILFRVVLHKSGKVRNVEVLAPSPCKTFNESALKLVKKLKFTPAVKNGQPVSVYKKINYEYYED